MRWIYINSVADPGGGGGGGSEGSMEPLFQGEPKDVF